MHSCITNENPITLTAICVYDHNDFNNKVNK